MASRGCFTYTAIYISRENLIIDNHYQYLNIFLFSYLQHIILSKNWIDHFVITIAVKPLDQLPRKPES